MTTHTSVATRSVIGSSSAPAGRTAAGRRRRSRPWREYALFLALIAPNLLIIAVFSYWPIIYNGYLSLTSWNFVSASPAWVGLQNYTDLFRDSDFHTVLVNTLEFTVVIVVGSLVLGLGLALVLNEKLRARGFVRTVAFAPHVVSGAAVASLWLFIFDPNYGLSRAVLQPLGVQTPNWTTDSSWSLIALMIVYLWKGVGFTAIVYIAGLQTLPTELYEAARLDGAGRWALFRRITLPLLSPVTFFLLVTTLISSFQVYDVAAVMTDGGPGVSSTTLSWYIYKKAFGESDAGHGAASAVIMFVLLIGITALQARFVGRRVHYQ